LWSDAAAAISADQCAAAVLAWEAVLECGGGIWVCAGPLDLAPDGRWLGPDELDLAGEGSDLAPEGVVAPRRCVEGE
jgi:hypothetical protein